MEHAKKNQHSKCFIPLLDDSSDSDSEIPCKINQDEARTTRICNSKKNREHGIGGGNHATSMLANLVVHREEKSLLPSNRYHIATRKIDNFGSLAAQINLRVRNRGQRLNSNKTSLSQVKDGQSACLSKSSVLAPNFIELSRSKITSTHRENLSSVCASRSPSEAMKRDCGGLLNKIRKQSPSGDSSAFLISKKKLKLSKFQKLKIYASAKNRPPSIFRSLNSEPCLDVDDLTELANENVKAQHVKILNINPVKLR